MSKKWTRNQKLIFLGIIVTFLVGFLGKININIHKLQKKIGELEIQTAEINTLKAEIAEIKELNTGKFKSECPDGTFAQTIVTTRGLEVVCQ